MRLAKLDADAVARVARGLQLSEVDYPEGAVPLTEIPQRAYQATVPFDFMFLSHSKRFTPESADPLYEEIRVAFIQDPTR